MIPIVWGTRMMGKVDAVPGVGHVATKFFYLQYIPLIPVETYLVFREVGEEIHGVRIPFSPKSIVIAWLRAGCVVAALGMLIAGVLVLSERHQAEALMCLVGAVVLVSAFIYSYYFGPICKASYNRAIELAQGASLGPEQLLALEIAYGRMNADQADYELARIYAEAQKAHERQLNEEPPPPDHFVFK